MPRNIITVRLDPAKSTPSAPTTSPQIRAPPPSTAPTTPPTRTITQTLLAPSGTVQQARTWNVCDDQYVQLADGVVYAVVRDDKTQQMRRTGRVDEAGLERLKQLDAQRKQGGYSGLPQHVWTLLEQAIRVSLYEQLNS